MKREHDHKRLDRNGGEKNKDNLTRTSLLSLPWDSSEQLMRRKANEATSLDNWQNSWSSAWLKEARRRKRSRNTQGK